MNTVALAWLAACAAAGILLCLVPAGWIRTVTSPFTFHNFGIRKIKRMHTTTDTLANGLETVCLLFCIIYPIVPAYSWIYLLILIFTFLCTLSRWAVMAAKGKDWKHKVECAFVLFGYWMVFAAGLLCNTVLEADNASVFISNWLHALFQGTYLDVMYYLVNPDLFFWLLKGFLMAVPVFFLWQQFKYLRLERTYRAANIFTYVLKIIFILALMMVFCVEGYPFLYRVYQMDYKMEENA
jgi:hypothetical protein